MPPPRRYRSLSMLCLEIAEEQLTHCQAIEFLKDTPLPTGGVAKRDDKQTSMKAALIAIEFSLAHLQTVTWHAINELHPQAAPGLIHATLEERLATLNLATEELRVKCTRLQALHLELFCGQDSGEHHVAQTAAVEAVTLAKALSIQIEAHVAAHQVSRDPPTQ